MKYILVVSPPDNIKFSNILDRTMSNIRSPPSQTRCSSSSPLLSSPLLSSLLRCYSLPLSQHGQPVKQPCSFFLMLSIFPNCFKNLFLRSVTYLYSFVRFQTSTFVSLKPGCHSNQSNCHNVIHHSSMEWYYYL
jgi:hypothetical protein